MKTGMDILMQILCAGEDHDLRPSTIVTILLNYLQRLLNLIAVQSKVFNNEYTYNKINRQKEKSRLKNKNIY